MTGVADGFKQRLKRRRAKWWGHPFRWTSAASYTRIPHRLAERVAWRSANDPDEAWRCCNAWPRTLINKWNGRQYALKHGCRVADLYWFGRSPRRIPFDALPPQFVIRPVHGYGRRGVLVVADGQELLRGGSASPSELRRHLSRDRSTRIGNRLLVEAFVRADDGRYRLPLECKLHMFGETVAAIQVIPRTGVDAIAQRYYTASWEPMLDRMDAASELAPLMDPPACLDEMIGHAVRLGRSLGTYMRIDFFSSDDGAVFNEFSSMPYIQPTPYCDERFGALWREKCRDAV